MSKLLNANEALEQIVRAALNNEPGTIQLGDVWIKVDDEGLNFDLKLDENWNREIFCDDLERLMEVNPKIATLMEKESMLTSLSPHLIDKIALHRITKKYTDRLNDKGSELEKVKAEEKEDSHPPPFSKRAAEAQEAMAYYKEGDVTLNGTKISRIIGRSSDFIVYLSQEEEGWVRKTSVRVEYWPDLPSHLTPSIVQYNKLAILAKCSLGPIHRNATNEYLAFALASAFQSTSRDEKEILEPFTPIEPFIKKKSEENARFSSIFCGGLFATLICIAIIYAYNFEWLNQMKYREVLFGAMSGTIGASVSVIQRGKELLFEPYAGSFFIAFQGILRITLGIIFGVFTVIAIKAGVLLNVANDNFYLLLMFCIIAGVSERFIPDLIERMENKNDLGNKQ